MNPNDHQQHRASPATRGMAIWRWARGGLIAAGLAALVVACGGGVGSGGTGGFSTKPMIRPRGSVCRHPNWWASLLGTTFAEIVTSALRSIWCSSISTST